MDDGPPDGGMGWIVVAGAFMSVITSYGTSTAWQVHNV